MSAVPVALNMVSWPPVASAVPFVPWPATAKKAWEHIEYGIEYRQTEKYMLSQLLHIWLYNYAKMTVLSIGFKLN